MQVIILAGGFGTRLQAVVPDLPKPMAPVAPRQRQVGQIIISAAASTAPIPETIVFPLYSRTGLRTAPSVAHLDSLGIAPLDLFSAQYENKLKTLYVSRKS